MTRSSMVSSRSPDSFTNGSPTGREQCGRNPGNRELSINAVVVDASDPLFREPKLGTEYHYLSNMAWSRTTRITIFLVIDVLFFIVELAVGCRIGSLALIADSFHMLNDVMSLAIALYAARLSARASTNSRLSYGWSRAEILAALINGVFLLALCFSIFLESIQRFSAIQEISNPRLIVIVGSLGLAFNILGLFFFHEHGHSHGHSHCHSHDQARSHFQEVIHAKPAGSIVSPKHSVPEDTVNEEVPQQRSSSSSSSSYSQESISPSLSQMAKDAVSNPVSCTLQQDQRPTRPWIPPLRPVSFSSLYKNPADDPALYARSVNAVPLQIGPSSTSPQESSRRHLAHSHDTGVLKRGSWVPPSRPLSYSSFYGHPAATRALLIQTAHNVALQTRSPPQSIHRMDARTSVDMRGSQDPHNIPDVKYNNAGNLSVIEIPRLPIIESHKVTFSERSVHQGNHDHHAHGHSHAGSMNMRALVLHVLGDALGNIGVIASGLIIWLAKGGFRFYFDPIISLIIAVIIFSSALPLVRNTAFILLQGVPLSISVEDVRTAILAVDGVLSLHELHVWQLSETKLVASVHVATSRKDDFMAVALNIRKSLHYLGIHSSTIQPEYGPPQDTQPEGNLTTMNSCLILCPSDKKCDPWKDSCCPPSTNV